MQGTLNGIQAVSGPSFSQVSSGQTLPVAEYETILDLQVAGELVKSKPTYVAIGDLLALPYADEVGLNA